MLYLLHIYYLFSYFFPDSPSSFSFTDSLMIFSCLPFILAHYWIFLRFILDDLDMWHLEVPPVNVSSTLWIFLSVSLEAHIICDFYKMLQPSLTFNMISQSQDNMISSHVSSLKTWVIVTLTMDGVLYNKEKMSCSQWSLQDSFL